MKEKYIQIDMDVICFETIDVITFSGDPELPIIVDDDPQP